MLCSGVKIFIFNSSVSSDVRNTWSDSSDIQGSNTSNTRSLSSDFQTPRSNVSNTRSFIRYPTLRSNILNTKRGVKTLRSNKPNTRKSVSTDIQTLKSDRIIKYENCFIWYPNTEGVYIKNERTGYFRKNWLQPVSLLIRDYSSAKYDRNFTDYGS